MNKDTAAIYTERFLNAFNIHYYLVEEDADADRISIAFAEAKKTKRPVAVLVADEYHGFNRGTRIEGRGRPRSPLRDTRHGREPADDDESRRHA